MNMGHKQQQLHKESVVWPVRMGLTLTLGISVLTPSALRNDSLLSVTHSLSQWKLLVLHNSLKSSCSKGKLTSFNYQM